MLKFRRIFIKLSVSNTLFMSLGDCFKTIRSDHLIETSLRLELEKIGEIALSIDKLQIALMNSPEAAAAVLIEQFPAICGGKNRCA